MLRFGQQLTAHSSTIPRSHPTKRELVLIVFTPQSKHTLTHAIPPHATLAHPCHLRGESRRRRHANLILLLYSDFTRAVGGVLFGNVHIK